MVKSPYYVTKWAINVQVQADLIRHSHDQQTRQQAMKTMLGLGHKEAQVLGAIKETAKAPLYALWWNAKRNHTRDSLMFGSQERQRVARNELIISDQQVWKVYSDPANAPALFFPLAGKVIGNLISRTMTPGKIASLYIYMDPIKIGFSQSSVSRFKTRIDPYTQKQITYSLNSIISGMKQHGWQGRPLNVVRMPDGSLTSLDNTRLLAARQARIDAHVNIHEYNAIIPKEYARTYTAHGKLEPTTWGEAIHSRIGVQEHIYFQNRIFPERFPNGSFYDPLITSRGPR